MFNTKALILVIDDQPGIRRMLTEVLEGQGYNVITAANGYEGIQMASDFCPDLILMDIKMPGMNGIDVLKELNRQGQCHKVIVMTVYEEIDAFKVVNSTGARDYINKPFDINALRFIIDKALTDFNALILNA